MNADRSKQWHWFKFDIANWRNKALPLKPNTRTVLLEIMYDLFENYGSFKLDNRVMARRCNMGPAAVGKAIKELQDRKLIRLEEGFLSCDPVTEQIKTREKAVQNLDAKQKNKTEKDKVNNKIRRNLEANEESIINNTDSFSSSARRHTGQRGAERSQRSQESIAEFEKRQANCQNHIGSRSKIGRRQ